MDHFRQALRLVARGPRTVPPEEAAAEDITLVPLARLPVASWRRLGVRVLLLLQSVRLQFVVSELVALPDRRGQHKGQTSQDPNRISKAEVLSRPRLSDSTSLRGVIHFKTMDCPHEMLLPRGGRSFWFNCRDCQARWPRTSQQEQIDYTL